MNNKVYEIIRYIMKKRDSDDVIATIADDSNLRMDLGFDSFELAELTVRIEDEFGVDVFAKGNIHSVKEIIDIIGTCNG